MSEITLSLPDGSKKYVMAGTQPLDVAKEISNSLAKKAKVSSMERFLVLCINSSTSKALIFFNLKIYYPIGFVDYFAKVLLFSKTQNLF